MNTHVQLTATIPATDGMTEDKAKTAALVTASQTFRVPLEVVSVKMIESGFEVTLRRIEEKA